MKGVLSQTLQNCFSEKWKNFSPLGNVSIEKSEKPICPFERQKYFCGKNFHIPIWMTCTKLFSKNIFCPGFIKRNRGIIRITGQLILK